MYYEKLRELFHGAQPSVRTFHRLTASLPAEEKQRFTRTVYHAALTEWRETPLSYRDFLVRFIESDLQGFLDYLRRDSCWNRLLIPLEDPELLMLLLMQLLEQRKQRKPARRIMAFSLLLLSGLPWKISTLLQYRKTRKVTAVDVLEMVRWMEMN